MTEVARVHGTSGTTGKPTVFAIGKGDIGRIADAHARIMWSFGMRQGDMIFIGSFFSLYLGSWGALLGAERLGATAFPFGAGVPSTKKRIEEMYGGICIDSGSTAEMTPWMSNCECEYRQGMHLWQDIVYAELLDPMTKKSVPYGQEGVTVYTHLERTSQPMIRFLANDISMWVNDPCPCGRTYPRLPRGVYGRADDMFVVRGENVYPSAMEDAIRGIDGFGDEFRISNEKKNFEIHHSKFVIRYSNNKRTRRFERRSFTN